MSDPTARLRTNLEAARISASDEDLAGIVAKGFLSRMADFERIVANTSGDTLPDYLDAASLPATAGAAEALSTPTAPLGQTAAQTAEAFDTIGGASAQIRSGASTPIALTQAVLARIAALDGRLNAFQLVLAEEALAQARVAQDELAAGHDRGPLHGVPVAVKDLFDMRGLPTAAGSKIRADAIADEDATVVARLRAAGAIIVGRTRMSEFAYSPGSNNAHYGPTANPYDGSRDAGGSSSGSAVAVAAGLAFAALGSDTGGSIRIPAAHCGLVGLKPTWGRISLAGAFPLAWSLDHAGPLARSVADAALLLQVLAGPDPRDGRTLRGAPAFMLSGLEGGVQRLRVGVLRDDGSGQLDADAEQLAGWRRGLEALATQGAELVELDVPEIDELRVLNSALLAIEAAALHGTWLRERLADYGEFMRQRVLAAFAYEGGAFVRGQQARAALRRRCAALFAQVDVLSTPCVPAAAPPLGTPTPTVFTGPFNCLGWPALSLPTGLSAAGLPLAMQLVARPWDEATLLRAAYAAEQSLGRLSTHI